MSTKWFDPRDLLFKSPFGAVPCGADVSFCFRPERGAAVTRCELLAHGEFADQWTTVELTPAQEDGHVVYRGIFTAPDDVELVWVPLPPLVGGRRHELLRQNGSARGTRSSLGSSRSTTTHTNRPRGSGAA